MKNKRSGNAIIVVLVLLVVIAYAYSCVQKENKAEQERKNQAEMEERQRVEERERQEQERKRLLALREVETKEAQVKMSEVENKKVALQQFALEHVSELWTTMRDIQALKEDVTVRMESLKKTLETMERKPEEDEDYQRMGQKRNELALVLVKLEEDLESAYIQYAKFQAAPDVGMLSNRVAKALSEGRSSGEQARKRYETLKKELMQ